MLATGWALSPSPWGLPHRNALECSQSSSVPLKPANQETKVEAALSFMSSPPKSDPAAFTTFSHSQRPALTPARVGQQRGRGKRHQGRQVGDVLEAGYCKQVDFEALSSVIPADRIQSDRSQARDQKTGVKTGGPLTAPCFTPSSGGI